MHTVLELDIFLAAAKAAGMGDEELEDLRTEIARDPAGGDVMSGTGGCRKRRYRKRGTGKSGGYRVIVFYDGDDIPVVPITVFGKSEKSNLTKGERNMLAKLVERLAAGLRKQK